MLGRTIVAVLLASISNAQSTATSQAMQQAMQACQGPLTGVYQNQQCAQMAIGMSQALSNSSDTQGLRNFCTSGCLPLLSNAYTAVGQCMQKYQPQLEAALVADGVQNASYTASIMMKSYTLTPELFNLYCTTNSRGEFCIQSWVRMSTDMSAQAGAATLPMICDYYYNMGCCLTSLDHFYSVFVPGFSFVETMSGVCPVLVDFNPPPCIPIGQRRVALSIKLPVSGLNCANYAAQSPEFQASFQAALRQDIATGGIPAADTTVQSVTQSGTDCVVTVVVRAADDTTTRSFATVAKTLGGVALTNSSAVLNTQPSTVNGALSVGTPTVVETSEAGFGAASSAAGLLPSFLVAVVTILFVWFA